jgi:BASS family bile acid:Na+ symporter
MKKHIRSISMIVAFLVGGLFHKQLAPLGAYLPASVALMLSITFLGIDVARLKPQRMHLWVLLGIQLIGMGFWGIARALGYPVLAESLFFCGIAPVAIAAPVIVNLLRGNVEFTTTALVLSQIVFGLVTPLLMPFVVQVEGFCYTELAAEVAMQLGTVLGIPALVAIVLRWVHPPCKAWPVRLRDVSLGIWIVNLTIIAGVGTQRVLEMDISWWNMLPLVLGSLLVCITGFVAGYRLGGRRLRRECSQCLGQKNTILTLYIASQWYVHPLAYIGPAFYVFFHNIANALQIALANREASRRGKSL